MSLPSVTRTDLPTPDAIIVMRPEGPHIVADHRVSTSELDAIAALARIQHHQFIHTEVTRE